MHAQVTEDLLLIINSDTYYSVSLKKKKKNESQITKLISSAINGLGTTVSETLE